MSSRFTSCIHNLGFLRKEQLKKHTSKNIHWTARTAWAFWVSNIDKSTKLSPELINTGSSIAATDPAADIKSQCSRCSAIHLSHTHTQPNHEAASMIKGEIMRNQDNVRDIQAKWRNMVLNVICQFLTIVFFLILVSQCSKTKCVQHCEESLAHIPSKRPPSNPPLDLIICCLDEAGAAPLIASGAQGWIADNLQLSKRLKKHPRKLEIHRSSTVKPWFAIKQEPSTFMTIRMHNL